MRRKRFGDTQAVRRFATGTTMTSFVVAAAAMASTVTWFAGCSTDERIKVATTGAPKYNQLKITYDLATTPQFVRLDQPADVDVASNVEQTSNDEPAPKGLPPRIARPWTRRRVHLELEYPFAGIHPSFARATLRIVTEKKVEQKPFDWGLPEGWNGTPVTYSQHTPQGMSVQKKPDPTEPKKLSEEDQKDIVATQEVLFIDLPKTELDAVLVELAKDDFFNQPSNPDAEAHVLVVLNKGQCEKSWAREDKLDHLVDLLRRHGTPVPATPDEPKKKA